jgi:MFS family permease
VSVSLAERPVYRSRLGLLAHRDFRLLWTGETTSSFGSSVSAFALPLVALTVLHASVLLVSIITAAAWLPWLVVGLPAGAWIDRMRRRPVMIAADLVSVAAFGSVVVAAAVGRLSSAQLVAAALVAGVATVFFQTAYRAYLPAVVNADQLLEGNAKLQGSEQVTHVIGPGAAGLIAQLTSAVGGVVVDVASFVVSALCLARMDVDEPAPAMRDRHLRREIGEGLALMRHDPLLRINAVFGCLANLTLTGYQAVLIVFLVRVVGLGPGTAGLLLALASLGGVVGALCARRVAARIGTARAVLLGKVGLAPFGLLIPLTQRGAGLALFLLGSVVIVGGIVAGNIIWSGWVQMYYPAEMLGRISTSVQVVNYGAIPLGAVLAGAIASAAGTRTALWVMLIGLVLSSLVLLLGPLRTLRDLPTHEGAA